MVQDFYNNREFYQIVVRNEIIREECLSDSEYDKYSRLASVIQGFMSYGENLDLLEISGRIVRDIEDSVEGYLTVEEVFKRIKEELKKIEGNKKDEK